MKKLFLIAAACMFALSASAQKYNVLVGTCSSSPDVASGWTQTLKSEIAQGFSALQRCIVIDGSTINGLSSNVSEALAQLNAAEIDCYYVAPNIESISTSNKTSKDGKTTYSAEVKFSMTLTYVNGELKDTYERSLSGTSTAGSSDAIKNAFEGIDKYVKNMAERNFLLKGEIVQLQEIHPKNGVKTCYINIGSNIGLEKGVEFEVKEEVDIAGNTDYQSIGKIKVKEVRSGTLAICTPTDKKCGKAILKSFEAERKLVIVSIPPKLIEDAIGGAIDSIFGKIGL